MRKLYPLKIQVSLKEYVEEEPVPIEKLPAFFSLSVEGLSRTYKGEVATHNTETNSVASEKERIDDV